MRKCPYCDFNSHPLPPVYDYAAYVDALLADLRFELGSIQGRTLETIFIGGGTPSLFPANQVKRVLDAVSDLVPCAKGVEVTLEANPGTLEGGRYAGYREAGINRLSIGVQSFNDRALQRLGRIHGADMALRAFFLAREAGFENINLDLMFGLPMQTVDEAGLDLETAITLAPEHISYYQLTIEPNTRFAVAPPPLPEEGRLWNIQTRGQKMLARAGYHRYEVSAYASSRRRCRHNLNYWEFGDYLGIGAGAHSKVSDTPGQRVRRCSRIASPAAFTAAAGTRDALSSDYHLSETDLIIEFMMNLLRLSTGFTEDLFQNRTGLPYARVKPMLSEALRRGLLHSDGTQYRPTALGHRYLNDLLVLFLD